MSKGKKSRMLLAGIVAVGLGLTAVLWVALQGNKTAKENETMRKAVVDYNNSPEGQGKVISSAKGTLTEDEKMQQSKSSLEAFEAKLADSEGKTIANYYYAIVAAHAAGEGAKANQYLTDLKALDVAEADSETKTSTVSKLETLLGEKQT